MTLGIRARLLAGFVAVALFTGVLGWYAVSTMANMNSGQQTTYGDIFGGTHLLAAWVDTSWEDRADLLDYLLTEDPGAAAFDRAEMARLDAHLNELVVQMDAADTDREDVETLAALVSAWNTYTSWRDQTVLGELARGDRGAALAAYNADGARMATLVDKSIDAFLNKKHDVGAALQAQAEASFEQTWRLAILLSVVAAGLGLGIGVFLSRSIARGVGEVARAAAGLADGDLDQHIGLESNDEIGAMAAAVREMIAYQQQMARVAHAIARGDLTQDVQPKADTDQLGTAFQHMIDNLRTLVGQLENAVFRANQLAELAEEREARMRAVLDSVADAIITFDINGQIETVNPAAEHIFGQQARDMVGADVGALLENRSSTALTTGAYHDLNGRRSDGTLFPIDLAVSEMRLAERQLWIASVRDITERKQADAKFRGLLESAPDAIVTVNRQGRIALVNTQTERLFGYDRSELLGELVEILLPERARAAHVRHRPRYLHAPTTRAMGLALELTARRKDGTEFPVEISLSPLESEDGILTTSVIRDITERKQAEDAQRFLTKASTFLAASLDYETTLASVARLAVPFLADGCLVEVLRNGSASDGSASDGLTAVAQVEAAGARLDGLLGDLPQQVLVTGEPYVCSEACVDPSCHTRLVGLHNAGFTAVMVVPLVASGQPLGVISFVASKPGRQYGPQAMGLAEELAHRCALAIDNARLYGEAQRAVRLRDDFFSVASHELKTPVAALLAYTQFMLRRAERQRGLTRKQMDEVLDEIHWQSDRIGRLVSQLLDTSRVDTGKLALEPELTDVAALVRACVYTARASNPGHSITVRAASGTHANVDPIRFGQVVTNLVDNAIKYSPDGGTIEVELRRPSTHVMRLTVTDHGIGIPLEHRAHVFDRFYQAHAGQHFAGVAGMGLGLYISRRIVEMHCGTIQLETPEGGGARVTVTLPVGTSTASPQRRATRQSRADSAPMSVVAD